MCRIRSAAPLLLILAAVMAAAPALAAPPVDVSHTLDAAAPVPGAVLLDYTLRVANRGDLPVTEVVLSHVPVLVLAEEPLQVTVPLIEPGQVAEVRFTVSAPAGPAVEWFARRPLFFAGSCRDGADQIVEFQAVSGPVAPGGAP